MKKFGFLLAAMLLTVCAAAVQAEDGADAADPAAETEETDQVSESAEDPEDVIAGRTNSRVRLRKEPSADAVAISTLEKGTEVFIYQSKSTDDFLYVRCYAPYGKEKAWLTGYVMWDYVDEAAEEEDQVEEVVRTGRTNSLVRLRKEPFSDGMTISKLPKGTRVYVYEAESTSNFLYVRCYASYLKGSDWITGYVMRKFVDFDDEAAEETTPEPEETAQPETTEEPAPEETAQPEMTEEPAPEETAQPEMTEEPVPEETAQPETTEEPAPEETVWPETEEEPAGEEPEEDSAADSAAVASEGITLGEELLAEAADDPAAQEKVEKELGPAQAGHTNNQVRMRKEPSRDSITMAKLAEGTKVYVYPSASQNGFLFVKCYAVSGNVQDWTYGYIMEKYVDLDADGDPAEKPELPETAAPEEMPAPAENSAETAQTADAGTGRQARTTSAVRLRKEADPKSMAVAKLMKDTVVYVFDGKSTEDYWYVKCCTAVGGKIGWINGYVLKQYVNASEAVAAPQETAEGGTQEGQKTLKEGKTIAEVRLRQEPASYSATVSELPKGTEIWVDESASTAHYWFVKCYARYFEGDKDWVTGYILKEYAEVNP